MIDVRTISFLKAIKRKMRILRQMTVKPTTWKELLESPKRALYAGTISRPDQYPGYIGLDPFMNMKNHIRHDVTLPMPIPDNTLDLYQSEDVFEHVPLKDVQNILNEIHRVLKPGGLLRVSLPDYRFDGYVQRSVKSDDGKICFDPGGGGNYLNGKVVDGGHLWFPLFEIVRDLFKQSNFEDSKVSFLHYNDSNGNSVTNPIDYSLGFVLRTPDHDKRAQNPYRAMSIVVDAKK